MLLVSIMLVVWFGFWLYFAWQKHNMMMVITSVMLDISNTLEEEPEED